MSKKIPEEKYQKTRSYRFWQWLNGTKDPYLDTVEMKPHEAFHEDEVVESYDRELILKNREGGVDGYFFVKRRSEK